MTAPSRRKVMYIVTIQKHHRLQYLLDDSKKDIQIILLECEAETLGPAAKEASLSCH